MLCERLKAAYDLAKSGTVELNLASTLVSVASCSRWSDCSHHFMGNSGDPVPVAN